MNKLASLLILIQSAQLWPQVPSTDSVQTRAVQNLIKRLIGEQKAASFVIRVVDRDNSDDWFSLRKSADSVHITASGGVAAAYGFHHYLKNFCGCHVSWDHDQLRLPAEWPAVDIWVRAVDRYRYYQNACGYSYSYAWWPWPRWEREIDWMALNGFNLALASVGQEALWRRVYRRLNATRAETDAHFGGPAFLAWARMGNIRAWGGPLTAAWHRASVRLQRRIVERMAELGVHPILPAFCGFVPVAFRRLFPNVKMATLPAWNDFPANYCCPYLVDPSEPLFGHVGRMFMREVQREFGLSHFYGCDAFNENLPEGADLRYLEDVNAAIFRVIDESDANGTWIMQGWLFSNHLIFWTPQRVKRFLDVVPNNRMIILDLHSELLPQYVRLDSYFGKPFIWCMLHNFGGTLGMHGSLDILNTRVSLARQMTNSTLIGTGLTPEGINQNYVVYDFMTEVSWRNASVDLNDWIRRYSRRRYGLGNANSTQAWRLLKDTVYNYRRPISLHGQYTLCVRPSLDLRPWRWYRSGDVGRAWDLMVGITDAGLLGNANFEHDIVDLSRQGLQLVFDELYEKLVTNFNDRNRTALASVSHQMLDLLIDLDRLLSTNARFILGSWLREAKSRAGTAREKRNVVLNAKTQITVWGPNRESSVLDYATKQWSGVVSDYYYPRWRLFCQQLDASLAGKVPFHQGTFDAMVYASVELPFVASYKTYPWKPRNDTMEIVKFVYDKWRAELYSCNSPSIPNNLTSSASIL